MSTNWDRSVNKRCMPGIVQNPPSGTLNALKSCAQRNADGQNMLWHSATPAFFGKRGDRALAPGKVWRVEKIVRGE